MSIQHTTKARVVRIHAQGGPEVLKVETVDIDPPGAGQALVRQTAIGLNYQDIYHRSGHYPLNLPSGLGTEAAGVVEQVGAGVTGLAPGDRVCYGGGAPGAGATYRVVPADRLIRIPDAVSDEQAAAVIMKGMTVEYLLNRCYPVQRGQTVLFHAAAGGVGLLAGQWGAHLGARMIGVASGAEKVALAKANGYAECIDRRAEDVAARIRELTGGQGVPVVYDSVGKDTFDLSLHALAPRGYFVSFGTTTGAPPPVEAATLQKMGSLYFTRPTLVTYNARTEDLRASAAAVFDLVAKGILKVLIHQRFALADIAQAHQALEAGQTMGSTIILP
ncbi:NADPH2:quinone reductase OS=Castellaniella defragrans OX=75697 GN=HNR28_000488 PE=4 SV=1 [Castellaniella defragrans]